MKSSTAHRTADSFRTPSGQVYTSGECAAPKKTVLKMIPGESFQWNRLSSSYPLVHILQPDYYIVFRFTQDMTPVYQQNLRMELGPAAGTFSGDLVRYIVEPDKVHLRQMDRIVCGFAMERRLDPFDFICSTICRWEGPQGNQRCFIRNTTILHSDSYGQPVYGLMTFKDVTGLVSVARPKSAEITFVPGKDRLHSELASRLSSGTRTTSDITKREREIMRLLHMGKNSKEIAGLLFISKATVDKHRQNMLHKWEVSNTAALLKRAAEEGCI